MSHSFLIGTELQRHDGSLIDAQMDDLFEGQGEEVTRYDRLMRSALSALEEGDTLKVFDKLKQALAEDPRLPDAYVLYSKAHLEREEYASAEAAARKAIEVAPYSAAAWHQHSRIQYLKGEYGIALEAAGESVKYTVGPRWDYFLWLGDLLFEKGEFLAAADRYGESQALLKESLAKVKNGIRSEENQREVTGIEHDVELRTNPLSGEVIEVPVTRLETDYKVAPNRWYEFVSFFEARLREVSFSRFEALTQLQRWEDAEAILPDVYVGEEDSGLYAFALFDYETANRSFERRGTSLSQDGVSKLFCYLISQLATGESKQIDKTLRQIRRHCKRSDLAWCDETLSYIAEYTPELKGGKVKHTPEAQSSREYFYRAQFHFAQEYPELAIPLLERALDMGELEGFEARTAKVQLVRVRQKLGE